VSSVPGPQTLDLVIANLLARIEKLEGGSGVRSTSTASGGKLTEKSFKDDFWTIAGGRVKFEEAFINDALIANLAVTTAKIANAAITNAKIEDATITSAKIGSAQIQTLHVVDGCVTMPKTTQRARWQFVGNQQNIAHIFAGGAYEETVNPSDVAYNKQELLLSISVANYTRVMGFPVLEVVLSPEFKTRVKFTNQTATDVQARVGLGYHNTPFAFSTNEPMAMSVRDWTVNTKTYDHLGMFETTGAEGVIGTSHSGGATIHLHAQLYKVSPAGVQTAIGSEGAYTVTETTKALVNFNINFATEVTVEENYALALKMTIERVGVDSSSTWFITSPVKGLTIPSGNSWTVYGWVWINTGALAYFYWGNSGVGIVNRSRLINNFPVIYFVNEITQKKGVYPCLTFASNDIVVLHGRWDHASTKAMWKVNKDSGDDNWLFEDNYITPNTPMRDGLFTLGALATGTELLYVFKFDPQEAWMS